MSRVLNEAEVELARELFGLADVVNAAARIVAAKKETFTSAQNELRAAEAGLQRAREELAAFMKTNIGPGPALL